jgi:hypothetical protein
MYSQSTHIITPNTEIILQKHFSGKWRADDKDTIVGRSIYWKTWYYRQPMYVSLLSPYCYYNHVQYEYDLTVYSRDIQYVALWHSLHSITLQTAHEYFSKAELFFPNVNISLT